MKSKREQLVDLLSDLLRERKKLMRQDDLEASSYLCKVIIDLDEAILALDVI